MARIDFVLQYVDNHAYPLIPPEVKAELAGPLFADLIEETRDARRMIDSVREELTDEFETKEAALDLQIDDLKDALNTIVAAMKAADDEVDDTKKRKATADLIEAIKEAGKLL